jgi:hypothetical protein
LDHLRPSISRIGELAPSLSLTQKVTSVSIAAAAVGGMFATCSALLGIRNEFGVNVFPIHKIVDNVDFDADLKIIGLYDVENIFALI